MGVSVFWILPEMAEYFSWPIALAWISGGTVLLALIDRYVYPVCPACSPVHDHDHCSTRLHGFATPLLAAAALLGPGSARSLLTSAVNEHLQWQAPAAVQAVLAQFTGGLAETPQATEAE